MIIFKLKTISIFAIIAIGGINAYLALNTMLLKHELSLDNVEFVANAYENMNSSENNKPFVFSGNPQDLDPIFIAHREVNIQGNFWISYDLYEVGVACDGKNKNNCLPHVDNIQHNVKHFYK